MLLYKSYTWQLYKTRLYEICRLFHAVFQCISMKIMTYAVVFNISLWEWKFFQCISMKVAAFFNTSLWKVYLLINVSLWKLQPFSIHLCGFFSMYLYEICICLSMYLNESGNLFQYISMKFQSFLTDNRGATPVQKSIRHHRSASLSRKTRNAIPENSNEDLSNLDEDPIPVR